MAAGRGRERDNEEGGSTLRRRHRCRREDLRASISLGTVKPQYADIFFFYFVSCFSLSVHDMKFSEVDAKREKSSACRDACPVGVGPKPHQTMRVAMRPRDRWSSRVGFKYMCTFGPLGPARLKFKKARII
jgi:hypothetical protein